MIVVGGEALVDLVDERGVLRPIPGGGPFNTAIALGRLGVPVAYLGTLSKSLYLPSVLTGVISQGSTDPYISVFGSAALVAKSWLDADPNRSSEIFGAMVQSITSGQQSILQALGDAGSQFDVLLRQATGQ